MEVLAPAKINLALDILGRRSDGYHEVEMIMQTIALFDKVKLKVTSCDLIDVRCSHPFVPSGKGNLAWRAANLLRSRTGYSGGARITIDKSIPVAAGLAGGSTDAAAVLRGLNQLWSLGLNWQELEGLARQVGADVPFCLRGGTALATGKGDKLQPLPSPPSLWLVLLKANLGLSTAEIYKGYSQQRVLPRQRPDIPRLLDALERGNVSGIAGAMGNVLETVAFPRVPLLKTLKHNALEAGALAAQMSGSGPTIIALETDYHRAVNLRNALHHLVEFAYVTSLKEGFK